MADYPRTEACVLVLTREEFIALVHRVGALDDEAERCADVGNWTAALNLIGASAEAILLATVCVLRPDAFDEAKWSGKGTDPRLWTLGQLIKFAKNEGWLPSVLSNDSRDLFEHLEGDVGDAVAWLDAVRNLATHAGAWLRLPEGLRPDFQSQAHMRPTFDILAGITSMVRDRTSALFEAIDTA